MIPTGVEARLRAHVTRVLSHAHLRPADREDVGEELYGHLVERWRALTMEGMDSMRAADEAVRSFGSANRVGAALTRSFRGQFWASTIGVLLPVASTRGPRPRIAWWLGASLRFYAVLAVVGAVVIASESSPVRAVIVLVAGSGTAAIYLLAAVALARRQRWGLDIAMVANVIGLASGIGAMMAAAGSISLNLIVSGLLLLVATAERDTLVRWVRRSRSVDGKLAATILAVVAAGAVLPAAASAIPDPTQPNSEDLHITAGVHCGDDNARVVVELRWDRTALLPGGVANVSRYGDLLLLETSIDDAWVLDNLPELVDVGTGRAVATSDEGYRPNAARMDSVETAPHAIQIGWSALEAGRTYRASWIVTRLDGVDAEEPFAAAIEYIHADRFRWEQLVDCYGGQHEPFVNDWP